VHMAYPNLRINWCFLFGGHKDQPAVCRARAKRFA
jgi:hypothetical protein